MTFLELCQELRRESGAAGTGPTAVTSQTGENLRLVNWVKESWRRIQRARDTWRWMRADAAGYSLVAGTASYLRSAIVASRFGRWIRDSIFLVHPTTSMKVYPEFMEWDKFRLNFLHGATPDNSQPQWFSIAPDESLYFHPPPDVAYVLRASYQKSAQELTANADEPEMPEDFHMAIVYGALMLYARYEAAQEILGEAKQSYTSEMQRLERTQLERMDAFTETLVE